MIRKLVFLLFLPLLGFMVIFTTMQSITDHSLQPRQDDLMGQLSNLDREVVIGQDEEGNPLSKQKTEEQFRGLVAWNMLAAQQCWYPTMLYQQDSITDSENIRDDYAGVMERVDYDESEFGSNYIGLVDFIDNGDNFDNNPFTFGYRGNEDANVLETLIDESDFQAGCMGIDPVNMDIPTGFGELIGGVGGEDAALADWEGHSLQGVFGQTEFKINESFMIDDHRLMAMDIGGATTSSMWYITSGAHSPDFPRGDRAAIFYPEGVIPEDSGWSNDELRCSKLSASWASTCYYRNSERITIKLPHLGEEYNSGDPGRDNYIYPYAYTKDGSNQAWRESFNAFRVRMSDVPHVATGDLVDNGDLQAQRFAIESVSGGSGQDTERSIIRGQHRYIVGRIGYLMCEGFEGYVQSNAGAIDEERKGYASDDPVFRDVVFPEVVVTNADEVDIDECMDDVIGKTHNGYTEDLGQLSAEHPHLDTPWIDGEILVPQ